jgi:ankyrin repeat protein
MLAAKNGPPQAVSVLLKAGAAVNHASREGLTALMQAARSQNIPAVKTLLEAGANPRAKDSLNRRAHHYARERGEAGPVLMRLLGGGPDASAKRPWWRFWES